MTDCIFCDIIAKKAHATFLHEDELVVVIQNIRPLAPLHLLIIPRAHFDTLNDFTEADAALAGHLLLTAKAIAKKMGVAEAGYRLALNTGLQGGQTVFHVHLHLLAGKPLGENLLATGMV
jgi:histidine triad (HIT) family protein